MSEIVKIDLKAAIQYHFDKTGVKITQKDIADSTFISEQNLSSWKKQAPQVVGDLVKISKFTHAPMDVLIKESE